MHPCCVFLTIANLNARKKKGVGAGSAYTLSGISKGSRLLGWIIDAWGYRGYPAKVGATLEGG